MTLSKNGSAREPSCSAVLRPLPAEGRLRAALLLGKEPSAEAIPLTAATSADALPMAPEFPERRPPESPEPAPPPPP